MGQSLEVSVVIPTFNRARSVRRAIDSVLGQLGVSPEVIVVDDGSTDATSEMLRTYGDAIRVISLENGGACRARNIGAKAARADYVMFLDSDDWISNDLLSGMLDRAKSTKSDIVFSRVRLVGQNSQDHILGENLQHCENADEVIGYWLEDDYVPPCGVLWRRAALFDIGLWEEERQRNQDGELVLRALMGNLSWAFSDIGEGIYDKYYDGTHISGRLLSRKELLDEIKLFNQISNWAEVKPAKSVKVSLGRAVYKIARKAYEANYKDLGDGCLTFSRELGFNGHIGRTGHGFISSMIGLRNKERLWVKIKQAIGRPAV